MKWSYEEVAGQDLVWEDSPFDWDFGGIDLALQESLQGQGVLVPLLAQTLENGKFRLIDGFKRVRILSMEPALAKYPCWVLPSDISVEHAVRIRATVQGRPNFKGMEICQILAKLARLSLAEPFLVEEILPKLGLKPSKKMMGNLLRLNQLVGWEDAPCLAHYTAEELLPLLHFSQTEIKDLLQNIKGLSLGGNKWKRLLEIFKEVGQRQGRSLSEIIKSPEVASILHNAQLQPPVRFRLLKQQLEAWRYPELTETRNHFAKTVQTLRLPAQCSLEYDPFFEKEALQLKIEALSPEALKADLILLEQSLEQESWEKLFQMLHGV